MKYTLKYYLGGEQFEEEFDSSHWSNLFEAVLEYLQTNVFNVLERASFTLEDEEGNILMDESNI